MVGLVVLPPTDEPPMDELPTPGRGDGPMLGVDPMVGLVAVPGLVNVGLLVIPGVPMVGLVVVTEAPGLGNVEPGRGDMLLPMAELPMPGDVPNLESVAEPGRALLGTTGMPMVPVEVPVDGPAVPGVTVLWAKQTGTTAVRAVATALRAVTIARAINLRLNVIACAPLKVVRNSEQNSILRNRALTPISS